MFPLTQDLVSPNVVEVLNTGVSGSSSHPSSLLYNLSFLKDKVSEVQTLVGFILSPNRSLPDSTSMAISNMISTIHEIIVTASSMMYTCQHMMNPPGTSTTANACTKEKITQTNLGNNNNKVVLSNIPLNNREALRNTLNIPLNNIRKQGFFSSTESEALDWFSNVNNCNPKDEVAMSGSNNNVSLVDHENHEGYKIGLSPSPKNNHDIIELNASDLLAKYTHYCKVCNKGFKRDANLRMHMRAHGDEYKTSAALKNSLGRVKSKKYSCPQEGCKWNLKHVKFQPLKSMICAKNHYKRTHCPKMYMCKRCNQKQFSVISDLRTHEKHCGNLKWHCSCGTTFSRKDKLMGHVALFVGHQPAATSGL